MNFPGRLGRTHQVVRDNWIVGVCKDLTVKEKLHEGIREADAHGVNEDFTRHLDLGVDGKTNEANGLPEEREGWAVDWVNTAGQPLVQLYDGETLFLNFEAEAVLDLGQDDFQGRVAGGVQQDLGVHVWFTLGLHGLYCGPEDLLSSCSMITTKKYIHTRCLAPTYQFG